MLINDQNYYPVPFLSMNVLTRDVNGKPTLTRFYKKPGFLGGTAFDWEQTWTSNMELDSWNITNVASS